MRWLDAASALWVNVSTQNTKITGSRLILHLVSTEVWEAFEDKGFDCLKAGVSKVTLLFHRASLTDEMRKWKL